MHKVSIPQDVIDRIMQQRGRINRFDGLDPVKTALVVVDLQNVFMLPGMPVEVPAAREIVPNVNRLAEATRAAGGTVVWVSMNLEGERDAWSVFFAGDRRRETMDELGPGSHGYALHADLDVKPEDLRIDKRRYSAFIQGSSDIDARLKARGIDTLLIVGTLTNVCCESTARDAMMLNYKVFFLSDANAANSDADHNATLATVQRVFGDVVTTDEAIGLLEGGTARAAAE
ncbi:MAG TPA: isochorismatase family cysteine hydrolase [Hyphomicrobiales bacterium]|nr:isochorismatase family cysteine hydrolase [Hyphomicrobiales bacterium]